MPEKMTNDDVPADLPTGERAAEDHENERDKKVQDEAAKVSPASTTPTH